MKRSEMLEMIEDFLDAKFYGEYFSPLYIEKSSEELLNRIEKAGMLPPPDVLDMINSRLIEGEYHHENIQSINDDEYVIIMSSLWEPEDD